MASSPNGHKLLVAADIGAISVFQRYTADCKLLNYAHPHDSSSGYNKGVTPLMMAARSGHANIVAHLIAACPESIFSFEDEMWNALHYSCLNGHAEVTTLLLEAVKYDMDSPVVTTKSIFEKGTPLDFAVYRKFTKVVEVFPRTASIVTPRTVKDQQLTLRKCLKSLGKFRPHPTTGLHRLLFRHLINEQAYNSVETLLKENSSQQQHEVCETKRAVIFEADDILLQPSDREALFSEESREKTTDTASKKATVSSPVAAMLIEQQEQFAALTASMESDHMRVAVTIHIDYDAHMKCVEDLQAFQQNGEGKCLLRVIRSSSVSGMEHLIVVAFRPKDTTPSPDGHKLLVAADIGALSVFQRCTADCKLLDYSHPNDPSSGYNMGVTPLMLAARSGHANIVAHLVKACPESVFSFDMEMWNALHYSCFNGHAEVAALLLEAVKYDMDSPLVTTATMFEKATPLEFAVHRKFTRTVEVFCKKNKRKVFRRGNKSHASSAASAVAPWTFADQQLALQKCLRKLGRSRPHQTIGHRLFLFRYVLSKQAYNTLETLLKENSSPQQHEVRETERAVIFEADDILLRPSDLGALFSEEPQKEKTAAASKEATVSSPIAAMLIEQQEQLAASTVSAESDHMRVVVIVHIDYEAHMKCMQDLQAFQQNGEGKCLLRVLRSSSVSGMEHLIVVALKVK